MESKPAPGRDGGTDSGEDEVSKGAGKKEAQQAPQPGPEPEPRQQEEQAAASGAAPAGAGTPQDGLDDADRGGSLMRTGSTRPTQEQWVRL